MVARDSGLLLALRELAALKELIVLTRDVHGQGRPRAWPGWAQAA